jgi:NADH-quinone oxidoreductase subunit E
MEKKLSAEALDRIKVEIAKYPKGRQQSAVMATLAIAQDERGWLSPDTLREVAEILAMPPMVVYEVASFYAMYRLKPLGRFVLTVCTNLPCALEGANVVGEHLKKTLKIDYGQTTEDGMFTLMNGECMGACGDGPVALLNNKRMCCKLSPDACDKLLAELRASADAQASKGATP